jgi:hypothetical protein
VNRRRKKRSLSPQQEQRLRECSDAKSLQTVLLKERKAKEKQKLYF